MVKLATFICGWFRLFPMGFFLLSGFGQLLAPLYPIFITLSIVSVCVWFFTHRWAERTAPSADPFMDYFWDLYDRSMSILEK